MQTPHDHIVDPFLQEAFLALSLEDMAEELKRWAKKEAIPALGNHACSMDIKFRSTRSLGRRIPKANPQNRREVSRLTDRDLQYWNAIMEMDPKDPLILSMKMLLHVGHGEFDIAWDYTSVYRIFAKKKTLAYHYLQGFAWRFDAFKAEFERALMHGMTLHGQKNYQAAIEHYNQLLLIHPKSAAALYERFRAAKKLDLLGKISPRWSELRDQIYECDPHFPKSDRSRDAYESYKMALRQETATLLLGPLTQEEMMEDIVRYADITLDLGDYAFAGHLYWLLIGYVPKDRWERDFVAYFMHCLKKLNIRELITRYGGDLLRDSRQISQNRRSVMMEHDAYKGFE